MLSYNFLLLKSAPLSQVERKSLWLIFCSTYLDMYDLALYVGYAIYLKPVLLPPTKLYDAFLIFSLILGITQLSKLVGVFLFNYLISSYTNNIVRAPLVIGLSYLLLAFIPSYAQIGFWSLYIFILLRVIQGCAFGFELGFTLNFVNMNFNWANKRFLYYFILFSGEIGGVISIFVNRFVVSHGASVLLFDDIIRFQYLFGAIFILFNLIFRIRRGEVKKNYSSFGQKCFFYTIQKNWYYILLRAGILCVSVSLIVMEIFRIPNFLHLSLGISQHTINHLMIILAISAFLGANFAKILSKYFSAVKMLAIIFVLVLIMNTVGIIQQTNKYHYIAGVYCWCFFYGMLIRLTPMVLYKVQDFRRHNRLTGRYLGHTFAYTLWGSITVISMDTSRYFTHNFYDNSPEVVLSIASLISLFALWRYVKHYH